jgi:5-methylcytosine-specific restriction endonuclease McrA
MRREAIVAARVPGKRPNHVACAECGDQMRESTKPPLFVVDHKVPASEPSALILNWNSFFDRLFVTSEHLQILCIKCHDRKTESEDATRVRRKRKKSNG